MKGLIRRKRFVFRVIYLGSSLFFLAALLYRCATPTAPQGGPRDETPPGIVAEESTPNFQTNFEKQTIELTFDEWVTLENVRDEVLLSPPIQPDPEYRLRKRTVQVIFADTARLRENVTYTINFGESVKDLNEKNPAEDLRFVFSTGPYIDSLTVSGSVVDVMTGEAVEDAYFMLYDNLADTVVRTERPFYFGKTNETGDFRIENIREGTYKAFALEKMQGSTKKYMLDFGDRLAFPDSLITVGPDTVSGLQLQLFAEELPLNRDGIDTSQYGKIKLTYNRPFYEPEIRFENVIDTPLVRNLRDSLIIWYDQEQPWTLYVSSDTIYQDTIELSGQGKATLLTDQILKPLRTASRQTIKPDEPPTLRYNQPLAGYDTSFIAIYQDSLRQPQRPNLQIDPEDPQKVILDFPWREEVEYELEILPGAFTDWYGLATQDTLITTYTLGGLSSYGNIVLDLTALDSTQQYLVQLMSKDLKQTVLTDTVVGVAGYNTTWSIISPGDYTLRVVTDRNRNGRWDTGNYDLQRQPEPIYLRPLDKLRANWDLKSSVRFGEIIETAEPEPKPGPGNNQPSGRPGRSGRNR